MALINEWDLHRLKVEAMAVNAVDQLEKLFWAYPTMSRAELASIIEHVNSRWGGIAAQDAADTMTITRAAAGITDLPQPQPVTPVTAEVADALAGWAQAGDSPEAVLRRAGVSTVRKVREASRETVSHSAEAAGTGWVRVPRPGTCAFCLMLASRGAVYSSRKDASVVTSKKARRRLGEKFHDNCSCMVVEVLPGQDPPRINQALEARWKTLQTTLTNAAGHVQAVTLDDWLAAVADDRTEMRMARNMVAKLDKIDRGGIALDPARIAAYVTSYRIKTAGRVVGGHGARSAPALLADLRAGDARLSRVKTFFAPMSDQSLLDWLGDDVAGAIHDVLTSPDGRVIPVDGWIGTAYHKVLADPQGRRVRLVVSLGRTKTGSAKTFKVVSVYPDAGDGVTAIIPSSVPELHQISDRPIGVGMYD